MRKGVDDVKRNEMVCWKCKWFILKDGLCVYFPFHPAVKKYNIELVPQGCPFYLEQVLSYAR